MSVNSESVVIAAESWSDGNVTTIAQYPLLAGAQPTWITSFHEPCGSSCARLIVRTIAMDETGQVYAGGQLHGSLRLGPDYYGKDDGAQFIIIGIEHGSVVKALLPNESAWSMLFDLELTNDGYLSGVGLFQSRLALDIGDVTSVGAEDVFALRLHR